MSIIRTLIAVVLTALIGCGVTPKNNGAMGYIKIPYNPAPDIRLSVTNDNYINIFHINFVGDFKYQVFDKNHRILEDGSCSFNNDEYVIFLNYSVSFLSFDYAEDRIISEFPHAKKYEIVFGKNGDSLSVNWIGDPYNNQGGRLEEIERYADDLRSLVKSGCK